MPCDRRRHPYTAFHTGYINGGKIEMAQAPTYTKVKIDEATLKQTEWDDKRKRSAALDKISLPVTINLQELELFFKKTDKECNEDLSDLEGFKKLLSSGVTKTNIDLMAKQRRDQVKALMNYARDNARNFAVAFDDIIKMVYRIQQDDAAKAFKEFQNTAKKKIREASAFAQTMVTMETRASALMKEIMALSGSYGIDAKKFEEKAKALSIKLDNLTRNGPQRDKFLTSSLKKIVQFIAEKDYDKIKSQLEVTMHAENSLSQDRTACNLVVKAFQTFEDSCPDAGSKDTVVRLRKKALTDVYALNIISKDVSDLHAKVKKQYDAASKQHKSEGLGVFPDCALT